MSKQTKTTMVSFRNPDSIHQREGSGSRSASFEQLAGLPLLAEAHLALSFSLWGRDRRFTNGMNPCVATKQAL